MWKILKDIVTIITLLLIGAIFLLIFSPFIILSNIDAHFNRKRNEKLYLDYLLEIDGHKLFCYNNRRDNFEFIEKQIIPSLPGDVKLIFLDGRSPQSDYYSEKHASNVLYHIQNKVGFPYLLRVDKGILLEKSINNELYNHLNQGHDIKKLYDAINKFYR